MFRLLPFKRNSNPPRPFGLRKRSTVRPPPCILGVAVGLSTAASTDASIHPESMTIIQSSDVKRYDENVTYGVGINLWTPISAVVSKKYKLFFKIMFLSVFLNSH